MEQLLYIVGEEYAGETGVAKKIRNEIKAFCENGINSKIVYVKKLKKWKKALPFSASFDWYHLQIPRQIQYIYIRYEPASYQFLRYLRLCRKNNPSAKIFAEIGTYPYIKELEKLSNPLTILRDKFYSRFLHKYIDKFVLFTEYESVYGVPAIYAVNSISVSDIVPPKRSAYRGDHIINVIAVTSVEFYYGYDRFLRGMQKYYQQKNIETKVYFHLVGNGTELPALEKMAKNLQLNDYVKFYGFLSGEALDHIYELADIGLDVLGGHRKDEIFFGTLKSREYMCKGIPFITEYPLPKNISPIYKYILKVPTDESDIDINSVINFYNKVKTEERKKVIENMREFAMSYCDTSVAMIPIITALREKKQ